MLGTLARELDERAQDVRRAAESANTVPPYNRRFSGRLDELLQLRERLKDDRAGVISGIHGLGGIGKTELAFAYAHAFAGAYPGGRFLLGCEGKSTLRDAVLSQGDFTAMFRDRISDEERKPPDAYFAAITACLRQRLDRLGHILLVLDNVTDSKMLARQEIDALTALGPKLHLLATTRLLPPSAGAWLTLGELPEADALELLEKHRPFADDAEREAARRIVKRLGGFALAVELVAAWLALLNSPEQHETAVRSIADAFVYALENDNAGLPLPVAADGSTGLHNAYSSGDLALFSDQGPGAGQQGDVRLAGFTAGPEMCGGNGFCLVLDGATGGNNSFAMLALLAAYGHFQDTRYLDAARTIGRWIVGNLADTSGDGYGGFYLGYPDGGVSPKTLIKSKSTENNADIFAALTRMATIERSLGNDPEAEQWSRYAGAAAAFVLNMYDPARGCFCAGTVPAGTPAGPGVDPTGPRQGDDIINVFDFLDSNTFSTLALAGAYPEAIDDWRRPVQYVLGTFAQSVTAGGQEFHGFSIVVPPTAGPSGVGWEFTGQAIVATRWVDALCGENRFEPQAAFYLDQIHQARSSAPFGDGRGVVATTLQDGDTLPPIEQCLSTPFQCTPERVGLAATAWAVFARQNVNPLAGSASP